MIIDLSVTNVDRVFQYRIPPELLGRVRVGVRVLAPFGRGDTLRKGYVVSLSHTPSFAPEKLKALREVDPGAVSVQEQMICLAWWMKERYGATMNQALKTVMPVKSAVAPKEEKTIVALRSREELSGLLREAEKKKDVYKRQALGGAGRDHGKAWKDKECSGRAAGRRLLAG